MTDDDCFINKFVYYFRLYRIGHLFGVIHARYVYHLYQLVFTNFQTTIFGIKQKLERINFDEDCHHFIDCFLHNVQRPLLKIENRIVCNSIISIILDRMTFDPSLLWTGCVDETWGLFIASLESFVLPFDFVSLSSSNEK